MTTPRQRMLMAAGLAIALPWLHAHAQDAPAPDPAAQEKAATSAPAERKPPPSLDDLLGLTPEKAEPAKPEGKPPAAPDPSREALDRRLAATQASEQFAQAVQLMGDTAQRLNVSRDTGIETQRLQEEIVRKLDMLIQMAEQQQQQQSSSSSSSGERDQQQQPAQPQQGEQQGAAAGADPADSDGLPPGEGPHLNPEVAARGASWGNLPDRARDALLQGNADTYSRMYQRWTEAYYRRLAEEGNR